MGKVKNFTDKVWYGTGAIGLDLSYGMFYEKLNMYLTDILGLNTNYLLGLTAVSRIWDGINDPIMGSLVDNTKTKFGRYRPWVVAGAFMNAVVLFLLFFNPGFDTSSPGVGLYIYVSIMYVLWGMTNTTADIPYWSMVPSFTTDPNERSILATVARAFSGLGQGIITICSPLVLDAFATKVGNETVLTPKGYMITALGCSVLLVFFAVLSMSRVKENIAVAPGEKFSFRKIFNVIKENDQLRVFMLFAMLSNAGFYTTSGVKDHFFNAVVGDVVGQSTFSTFGTVGSVLGMLVIPIMMKFTTRRRTYQFSLSLALAGYLGMLFSGGLLSRYSIMNIFYVITQIGTASMFISQTVFLSDVVDYGEVKMGVRRESVTFSMKGFLQKMAYTVQTIILYSVLGISGYNKLPVNSAGVKIYTPAVKKAISGVMFIVPPVFFILSLIVFTTRFRLYGEYMESITEKVEAARQKRLAEINKEKEAEKANG